MPHALSTAAVLCTLLMYCPLIGMLDIGLFVATYFVTGSIVVAVVVTVVAQCCKPCVPQVQLIVIDYFDDDAARSDATGVLCTPHESHMSVDMTYRAYPKHGRKKRRSSSHPSAGDRGKPFTAPKIDAMSEIVEETSSQAASSVAPDSPRKDSLSPTATHTWTPTATIYIPVSAASGPSVDPSVDPSDIV
jgi:hypothetical protein